MCDLTEFNKAASELKSSFTPNNIHEKITQF